MNSLALQIQEAALHRDPFLCVGFDYVAAASQRVVVGASLDQAAT
jgi:hypothetical protein